MSAPQDEATRTARARHPAGATVYAVPWALLDGGVATSLDDLRSCGVGGIQLALSYHVASYLAPMARHRRVVASDLGGLHFDPDATRAEWPFRPAVSTHVARSGSAEPVLEAAADHGLAVVAWVVYLYNHALARARPELAVHDVYGEPSGAHLCPTNPDVRRYVRALTQAVLTLGPLAGLDAESLSYLPFDYGLLNLKTAVRPSPRARRLLGLCHCRHCRRAAAESGVDVDAFGREARRRIDVDLRTRPGTTTRDAEGPAPQRDGFDQDLEAWMNDHARSVEALHDEVFALAGEAGISKGSNFLEADPAGVDARASESIRRRVDAVRVRLAPALTADELAKRVAASRRGTRSNVTPYAFVDVGQFDTQPEFADAIALAADQGIRHYRFYQLNVMAPWHLDWIHAARAAWEP